jgi:hypothetical protein
VVSSIDSSLTTVAASSNRKSEITGSIAAAEKPPSDG